MLHLYLTFGKAFWNSIVRLDVTQIASIWNIMRLMGSSEYQLLTFASLSQLVPIAQINLRVCKLRYIQTSACTTILVDGLFYRAMWGTSFESLRGFQIQCM